MNLSLPHSRSLSTVIHLGLVLALFASIWGAMPVPASYAAVTITVTETTDELNNDGDCSLREAISAANTNSTVDGCVHDGSPGLDIIVLPAGTFSLGASNGLDILGEGGDLTIAGAGTGTVIIDGNGTKRVFDICPAGACAITVTFDGLIIRNGSDTDGGGIYNRGSTLHIVNSRLSDNNATGSGGGIYNSGGTLDIAHSTLADNTAVSDGGCITNEGGAVTIANSLLDNNDVTGPGGRGGGILSTGTLTITHTTLRDSDAADGGGIYNTGILNITNSTLADNTASGGGGGIYNDAGNASLTHVTLATNSASLGSGGNLSNGTGTVDVAASIIAEPGGGGNCAGTITNGGQNLEGEPAGSYTCGFGVGSQTTVAGLRPLVDNGGPVLTIGLQSTSPAVNGTGAACAGIGNVDQRYFARSDGNCDIGAFEYSNRAISGYVWYDLDEDGQQDATEPGYDGATVTLDGGPINTTTANGGYYHFTGLSQATYTVTFSNLPGGYTFTAQDAANDTIDSDANTATGQTGSYDLSAAAPPIIIANVDAGLVKAGPPNLSIVKAVDNVTPLPGQLIAYTLVISNSGGTSATNALISDTLPGELTYVGPLTLDPPGTTLPDPGGSTLVSGLTITKGETITLTFPVVVNAGLSLGTVITNSAWVTSAEVSVPQTGQVALTVSRPDLSIAKSADRQVAIAGEPLTYTIIISNVGTAAALDAVLSDALLSATFAPAYEAISTTQGSCAVSGTQAFTCPLGTIPVNGIVTVTARADVGRSLTGTITNTVSVTVTGDVTATNDSTFVTTTIASRVNLHICKDDEFWADSRWNDSDPVHPGYPITYALRVYNEGPSDAWDILITDTVPTTVTGVTANNDWADCILVARTITCTAHQLPAYDWRWITIAATAPLTTGVITNTAWITASGSIVTPTSDISDTETTSVELLSDLEIVKTVTPVGSVSQSAPLTYTLAVTNNGPAAVAGTIIVTDQLPSAITTVVPSGTNWTCDLSALPLLTCTLSGGLPVGDTSSLVLATTAPITVGLVLTNSAAVTATISDPLTTNNSSFATITVGQLANIAVNKTVKPALVQPDKTLTFTITITNYGPMAATAITVTDIISNAAAFGQPSGASCILGSASVMAGNRFTCAIAGLDVLSTTTIVVTATAPTSSGTVTNTAWIASDATDPQPENNRSTIAVAVTRPPTADAGLDQIVYVNEPVVLDGTSSADPDNNLPLAYSWQQTGGPPVTLSSTAAALPTFVVPSTPAVFIFALRVTDALGMPCDAPDTVVVTAVDHPITGLQAFSDSPTYLGDTTALWAAITVGTNVTYQWDLGDGNAANGHSILHNYAAEGWYTAIVTASNSTNSLSVITLISVTEPPTKTLYMPIVLRNHTLAPDLVVERIVATGDRIQVVISNRGNTPVENRFENEFWVDVYINPDRAPTFVTETWRDVGSRGIVWGITQAALPLLPGKALTLTVTSAGGNYYFADESRPIWPLPAKSTLYAQVDSSHGNSAYGAVVETHEIIGAPYRNNILGPITSTASVLGSASRPDGGGIWPAAQKRFVSFIHLPSRP